MADVSHDKVLLCHLMRENSKYDWSSEHIKVIRKIKNDLITAPAVVRPDFEKKFTLHCDASDFAIGAVRTQEVDGEQHSIIFVNRRLTAAERKFATTKKECLAVIRAVERLRQYLEGFSFTVHTDHSSLL